MQLSGLNSAQVTQIRSSRLWLKLAFLFASLLSVGATVSWADTLSLSGESLSGTWRPGLSFTGVDIGPITLQANVSSAAILVGYVDSDPSQWRLQEEDFWEVGVRYTVNGVAQAQNTLFDSQPEVICLTPSCSDSTPNEWAIDTYLNPGAIRTSSGEIIASLVEQGAFAGGDMLIPASNGAQQYALYYRFTLVSEPASYMLIFAGIVAMLALIARGRHTLSAKTNMR